MIRERLAVWYRLRAGSRKISRLRRASSRGRRSVVRVAPRRQHAGLCSRPLELHPPFPLPPPLHFGHVLPQSPFRHAIPPRPTLEDRPGRPEPRARIPRPGTHPAAPPSSPTSPALVAFQLAWPPVATSTPVATVGHRGRRGAVARTPLQLRSRPRRVPGGVGSEPAKPW